MSRRPKLPRVRIPVQEGSMVTPTNTSGLDHEDIDLNSSQMIRICIGSINHTRVQFSPSEFGIRRNQLDDSMGESGPPVAEHDTRQGHAKTVGGDTNLHQVLTMPADQLELLHRRVQQLELSNYGLLKRVYGTQISAAPYALFNGPSPASMLEKVPESYRYRLYEQYQKMMSTARNPRSLGLEPMTAEGARLLQEYLSQLRLPTPSRGEQQIDQAVPDEATEHRPPSRQLHRRRSSKVDKKAIQAYKSRLDCWNGDFRLPGRHSAALTDYQTQLMLLEEQNQQRLSVMKSQQKAQSPRLFNWVQYDSQLAARQASHLEHKLDDLSPTSAMLPILSASPEYDVGQNSSTASPVEIVNDGQLESVIAEPPRGRPRKVKLPTRERRKPLNG